MKKDKDQRFNALINLLPCLLRNKKNTFPGILKAIKFTSFFFPAFGKKV